MLFKAKDVQSWRVVTSYSNNQVVKVQECRNCQEACILMEATVFFLHVYMEKNVSPDLLVTQQGIMADGKVVPFGQMVIKK